MRDGLAELNGESPVGAFNRVRDIRRVLADRRRAQRLNRIEGKPDGAEHHGRRAAHVATDAVCIVSSDSLLVGGRFSGRLEHLALVLVLMMAEMFRRRPLFVLAVARRSAPDELERQEREQEDDDEATHVVDAIRTVSTIARGTGVIG